MRNTLGGGFPCQAVIIQPQLLLELLGKPSQPRHPGLFTWRYGVGRAVQIHALLPQGFTVIGQIHHCRIIIATAAFELLDHLRDDIVGIQNCVVIGIGELLAAAVLNVTALAIRGKTAILLRIAQIIGRSVTADDMQHYQAILAIVRLQQGLFEFIKQYLILTKLPITQLRVGVQCYQPVFHPVTHSFTAAVVIKPLHFHTGMVEHIHSGILSLGSAGVIIFPAHSGKHTG